MQIKVTDRAARIEGPLSPAARRAPQVGGETKGPSFSEVLGNEQKRVSFSKHAEERLQASGQVLDPDRMAQLENAVDVASSKGAHSTLVLMRGMALVVAPQSRTVVTVIPEDRMKEKMFTAIDSAVVVGE